MSGYFKSLKIQDIILGGRKMIVLGFIITIESTLNVA
jgi:hypothetical protein